MSEHKKSFREIARICEVSPATVSRIANGVGSFTDETREKVVSILLAEGYPVQGITVSTPQVIAAVVTDLSNELYNTVLSDLKRYLARHHYLLQIYVENEAQETWFEQLLLLRPFGILFIGTPLNRLSLSSPVPVLQVLSNNDVRYQGCRYSIQSDEYVGGQLAARELLAKNCKAPLILNNRHTSAALSPRIQGFLHEMEKAGIDSSTIPVHDGEPHKSAFNSAHDRIAYLCAKGVPFDSVFACSDWRAYGAMTALRKMNVDVPEHVKIIGFDGERVSTYCDQPFATIQQNPDMIASAALSMLLELIEGRTPAEPSVLVPVQVQTGLTI